MKVAVIGSRGLHDECYDCISDNIPVGCSEIITGGAVGIDTVAARYASEHSLKLSIIEPDYDAHDRSAPIIRNEEIVRASDFVLVIWDGRSRGSLNVIMTCLKINKPVKVMMKKK